MGRTVSIADVYDEDEAERQAEEIAREREAERRRVSGEASAIVDTPDVDAALEGLRGFSALPADAPGMPPPQPEPGARAVPPDAPPVRSASEMQRIREQPPEAGQWPFQGQDPRGAVEALSPDEMARRGRVEGEARAAAMRSQQRPSAWFAGGEDDAPPVARPEPTAPQMPQTPRAPVAAQGPAKMSGAQYAAGAPGRLDEGLPSEGDVQREQALDVPRRILRALAMGLSGGRAGSGPLRGEQLAQQRSQGLDARMRAKAGERERELGADEQMRRQRAIDARQQAGIEAQSARDAAAAEQRAADRSVRERQIGVGERRLALTEAEQQREQGERDALADPASAQSAAARRALLVRLASVTDPAIRSEYASAGLTPGAIQQMSARDVSALLDGSGQLVRPATMRDSRRRGEGGGGRIGGGAPDGEGLVARAVEMGMPEEAARAMRPRDLARMLATEGAQRTRRTAQTEAGEEILPGVIAGIDLDRGEGRALRTGFTQARTQYASLGEIDRIAQRYGASGVISPEVAGELGGPLSRLRAMVAQLQNTGVINPSEAPAIEAMLPDPRSLSQMTFGTLQGRLASFRRELESAVESELVARGVQDDGIDTAIGYLRGGRVARGSGGGGAARSVQPQTGEATVRVRRISDGAVREVPRATWERASAEQRAQYEEAP